MKYLDLFSGYGGFSLGIHKAYEDKISNQEQVSEQKSLQNRRNNLHTTSKGDRQDRNEHPTCIGFSEIDKYASQVLKYKFPNIKNYGDITKINPRELPDFDLITGGFPCQAFSIAGKRKGFDDTRGTLFFDIARIIKEKRPKYLLLENVKGLLSHDAGRTFKTIISSLDELGYDVEWQVLNAKNFGVPQNRERVFIIGHLRGESRPKVFPIRGANSKAIEQINQPKHSNDRVYSDEGLSPTLNTMQGGNRQPFIADYRYDEGLRIRKDFISPTIRQEMKGQDISKSALLGRNNKIRRLTPTECERLMGLEDGWTKYGINDKGEKVEMSDTQRYKMAGNGIVINCVEAIITKLLYE